MKNVLKNNSVTMIKLNVFTKEHDELFNSTIQPLMASIFDSEDDKYIAVEEIDGHDVMFLFVEQHKVDAFINLFDSYNLIDTHKEITKELLMGEIDTEFLHVIKSDEFKHIFDTFILKNLDIDMVLDKIIESGMDSLTDNDKVILENQNIWKYSLSEDYEYLFDNAERVVKEALVEKEAYPEPPRRSTKLKYKTNV